jgi:D-inositol-3-phosphate glycosyltransferase
VRILFVAHYALPHVGGIETTLDAVATALVERGHDVSYLASAARRPAERASPLPERAYRRVLLPALNAAEERAGAPYPVFGPGLARAASREVARADVVHAHGFLYMGTLAALAAAGRHGVPAVLSEHVGHVPYSSAVLDRAQAAAIRTLGRWSLRRADAVLALNENVRAQALGLAPGARVEIVANGVDLGRFRPAEDDGERARLRAELGWDDRPRVLFVGRRVAKKGLDLAMAATEAAAGAFELVVAGTETGSTAPAGVEVLGHLDPERMPELMRAADALLLPSRGEGFPVAVQEAMASGLPVVLADDPVYRDRLDGAGAGAVAAALDAPSLAAATTDLVSDPQRLAAASRSAVEHARRRFGFDQVLESLERLYAELGQGPRA